MNTKKGNRALSCSLSKLKKFVGRDMLHPSEITENFCKRFKKFLMDTLTDETPANYYTRFRWVLAAATADGYYRTNPTANVFSESNPSIDLKANLEVEDYLELLRTPCNNEEVQMGFLFSCYTGLRWIDVKPLTWSQLSGAQLTTRIIQQKTGKPVVITLHPMAQAILRKQAQKHGCRNLKQEVFQLPTQDGANKVMRAWVSQTTINKHITWSCARLSFSILLKDQNVEIQRSHIYWDIQRPIKSREHIVATAPRISRQP